MSCITKFPESWRRQRFMKTEHRKKRNRIMGKYYKALLILTSFLLMNGLCAQSSYNTYFVQFTDKENSTFSLSNPREYLSEKAVERRIRTGLGFDSLDIPVNANYIQQVLQQGNSNLLLRKRKQDFQPFQRIRLFTQPVKT